MGRYHLLFLTLCWSLLLVALADADLEVKGTSDTGLDPNSQLTLSNTRNLKEKTGGLNSDTGSDKVDREKNDENQVGRSKKGVEGNKEDERNPSDQKDVDLKGDEKKGEDGPVGKGKSKSKVGDQVEKKGEDGSVGKGETKGGDQVEKKGEDGSVGKGETKEGDQVEKKGEDGSVGKGETKDGDHVEKKGEDGSVGKGETKDGDQVEKKGEDGSGGKGETKEGDQVEKKDEDGSVGKGETKDGDQVEKKGEDGSVGEGGNKEGDQVEKKGEDGSVGKGGNKEGDQVGKKDEDGSVEKGGNKEGSNEGGKGDKKDGPSGGSGSKEAKEVPTDLPQERKEGPHGEECDASNSCKAEKDALIACLRVPGNDSPDLSLLIQNKGNDPLSVAISAPNFVLLEKRNVQLRQKEDIKVKVSITDGTEGKIVLTAGSSNCIIDLRDLPSLNPMKETDDSREFSYISLVKKPHIIAFIAISTLMLITASAWTCVRFKRKHFDSNASKYQKLEMELPVSGGGKVVMSEVNDDWDNNWDDNWDDEEAPMTPSMPLTPSVSSKGLASRRLTKEAWKD